MLGPHRTACVLLQGCSSLASILVLETDMSVRTQPGTALLLPLDTDAFISEVWAAQAALLMS